MSVASAMPPLVILLDIDGTLIGDITPQAMMYDISNTLKGQYRVQFTAKHVQSRLRSGVTRPFAREFVKDLQAYGVEFFIYTASEKRWAEYIVKQIEAAHGIKFNRPLFTRNDCQVVNGEYKKSISRVLPSVVRCLKKRYPRLTGADLRDMVIAIDNNPVYSHQDSKSLVLCSTYNYSLPENLPAHITKEAFERHHGDICSIISGYYRYFRNMKVTPNFMKFERQFYFRYIDALTAALKERKEAATDPLFKTIRNFILSKNIKSFNEKVVQYLNTRINGRPTEQPPQPHRAHPPHNQCQTHTQSHSQKKRTFF